MRSASSQPSSASIVVQFSCDSSYAIRGRICCAAQLALALVHCIGTDKCGGLVGGGVSILSLGPVQL